ncbi:MAG: hypothetical protein GEU68_16670 [Actinobacteria bacterium]|nr:hypothetical protein [Actinomycetota bacterium]
MDHLEGSYVWPHTLRRPQPPPKLVYLDLNHWIALAKALVGHRDGRTHEDVLSACIRAVERGSAIFPISDTIYFEVSKIGPYRQRRDLHEVIEQVSRYFVVTARSVISAHEIEALLDRIVGPNPEPINTMDYLDWGVARAFGMMGGFKVKSASGEDVTAEVRASHSDGPEAFDRALGEAELELNRKTLQGPSPEEEPEMRRLGWDPRAAFQVTERRAQQEIDQVARFDDDPESKARGVVKRQIGVEVVAAFAHPSSEVTPELAADHAAARRLGVPLGQGP